MVFINFLIKPFWVFGIDRTVQNKLGEQEYGLYFAIFNFTYLFQILLDFGLQNYNNREVAADNKKIDELLPGILILKTILFLIYLVICIAVAYPLGYLSKPFIWIILVNQILLSFNIYLRSNISAHQQFIKDALLSVLDKLLMIVFCAALIWGDFASLQLSIFNFVLAQLAAYFITFLVCFYFAVQLTNTFVIKFDWKKYYRIAQQTLPYAIIYFLMTTYYRIDGVMLEKLQGANGAIETGIYAQGYRIMESLNNIGYLFAGILLPLFAFKLTKNMEIKSLLKSGISIMFGVSVSMIVVFYYYKFDIMQLLYPNSDIAYSANVFGYLLLNFFPVAILYVIGTLLTANKNFRWMIYTLLIAVFLNIGLNFYLITNYGAKGAAQATLITQIFMLVCYTVFAIRIFKLKINFIYSFKLLLFTVLCFIILFLFKNVRLHPHETINLVVHILLYFAFIPIISMLSGLINRQTFQLRVGIDK